tara:strand:+ start:16089 stop:18113 length:2025 start_codon:yes stop_codon:yes gene_type:complete
MDYGYFEAMTPTATSGAIQDGRDRQRSRQLQLAQQQQAIETADLNKKQAYQTQINTFQNAALDDVFYKNQFKRKKDLDDYRNWHKTHSGWGEIQNILREHNSINNARQYGNLDYALQVYYQNVKDNPISQRVSTNKNSLEKFHSLNLDDGTNKRFLTQNDIRRYNNYKTDESEGFYFGGGRSDYLEIVQGNRSATDRINVDEILYDNYSSIAVDMIKDVDPSMQEEYSKGLTDEMMKDWLKKELNHEVSGGEDYFSGKAVFGTSEVQTNYGSEFKTALAETKKIGLSGNQILDFIDQGVSFNDIFSGKADESINIGNNWQHLGGYDSSRQVESYKGMKAPFAKGTEVVASGQLFAHNKQMETVLANSIFGKQDADGPSRYNSKNRSVYDLPTLGLYTKRGRPIKDEDIGFGAGVWQEWETMNKLEFKGFHVGLQAKGADGETILLTDVTNKEDKQKLKDQYGSLVFEPVMMAELIDKDIVTDDAYYKVVDLNDIGTLEAINKNMDPANLNQVLNQVGAYDERLANNKMNAKRKTVAEVRLQKQLNLPNPETVPALINGYNQNLSMSLLTSGVNMSHIQNTVPLLLSDLYVDSQKDRAYPHVFNNNMVANNPGEYMAMSAKLLSSGLVSGGSGYKEMLEAINTGNYNKYSETFMNEKDYKTSRRLSKDINIYQNL